MGEPPDYRVHLPAYGAFTLDMNRRGSHAAGDARRWAVAKEVLAR